MGKKRSLDRILIIIAFTGILLCLMLVSISSVCAEEDIAVNCYIKTDDDYLFIDNVVVYDASQAASTCNAVYVDCKGQCIGCLDSEGEQDCYDSSGNKFLKSWD
jgi:hypothetical protein